MTRLSVEQEALLAEAGRAHLAYSAERAGAHARIRALVAAEVSKDIDVARQKVTAALEVALRAGVPKVRLKEVTTKDRRSFQALLPTDRPKSEIEPQAVAVDTLEIRREGELLRVTIDPATVVTSDYDREDFAQWTGLYAPVIVNGKTYIDPHESTSLVHGLSDWIGRDRENEKRISAWVDDNPRR